MPDFPFRTRFTLDDARYIVLGTRQAHRSGAHGPACDEYEVRQVDPLPLRKTYLPRAEVHDRATRVVVPNA